MKNDLWFRSTLQNEIPRKPLSKAASKCFVETCRRLGVQKEKPTKLRRRLLISLSSFAACLFLLFSVNLAFPAFAESLPLIGPIFASFHGKPQKNIPMGVNDRVASHAVVIEQAGAEHKANPVDITLSEASCDGWILNLSLRLTINEDFLEGTDYFHAKDRAGDFLSVTANDTHLSYAQDALPFFQQSDEDAAVYYCTTAYYLPETLREAELLTVEGQIEALSSTRYPGDIPIDGSEIISDVLGNWNFKCSVPVNSSCQTYTPHAEFGGVVLTEVTLGNSMLDCEFLVPEGMEARAILNPLDDNGKTISHYSRNSQVTDSKDGVRTVTLHLSAPETDTDSLTFQIIQWPFEGETPDVIGSYTLNLE